MLREAEGHLSLCSGESQREKKGWRWWGWGQQNRKWRNNRSIRDGEGEQMKRSVCFNYDYFLPPLYPNIFIIGLRGGFLVSQVSSTYFRVTVTDFTEHRLYQKYGRCVNSSSHKTKLKYLGCGRRHLALRSLCSGDLAAEPWNRVPTHTLSCQSWHIILYLYHRIANWKQTADEKWTLEDIYITTTLGCCVKMWIGCAT